MSKETPKLVKIAKLLKERTESYTLDWELTADHSVHTAIADYVIIVSKSLSYLAHTEIQPVVEYHLKIWDADTEIESISGEALTNLMAAASGGSVPVHHEAGTNLLRDIFELARARASGNEKAFNAIIQELEHLDETLAKPR